MHYEFTSKHDLLTSGYGKPKSKNPLLSELCYFVIAEGFSVHVPTGRL